MTNIKIKKKKIDKEALTVAPFDFKNQHTLFGIALGNNMTSDCTSSIGIFMMAMGAVLSAIFYHHLLSLRTIQEQSGGSSWSNIDNYKPKIYTSEPNEYRFAMIADLDKDSKYKNDFKWRSFVIVSFNDDNIDDD